MPVLYVRGGKGGGVQITSPAPKPPSRRSYQEFDYIMYMGAAHVHWTLHMYIELYTCYIFWKIFNFEVLGEFSYS